MTRRKKEDFAPNLVKEFSSWACGTNGMPTKREHIEEAMSKFNLTEEDVWALLHITAEAWVF